MRPLHKSTLTLPAVIIILLSGCTKSSLKPNASTPAAKEKVSLVNAFSNDDEFSTETTDSGTIIIKYRPNPGHGEDVYSDLYWGVGSGNQNYVPELPVNAWDWGGLIITRSFLKFSKLYKFPDTLNIISAKLFLYPPEGFLNHPQGNTGANECVIQRIVSNNWEQETLTWNTQPQEVTTEDLAFIPATNNQFGYAPVIDITAAISKMVTKQVHNYGFRITLVNEQPFAAVNFASSEAADRSRRPMLVIECK